MYSIVALYRWSLSRFLSLYSGVAVRRRFISLASGLALYRLSVRRFLSLTSGISILRCSARRLSSLALGVAQYRGIESRAISLILAACSTPLCSFGWKPVSTLGWKPAPEFLASFASGEHPAAKEDAVPASASLMQVRWMDWMDQPHFSGCPATMRGIDLTLGAAGANALCSFGWKPVSRLGWKPLSIRARKFCASFHTGYKSGP